MGRRGRTYRTRALVVRWVPFSNTSQIVTVFTRDHGLVSLLAKGSLRQGRRSSSFPIPFDLAGWYDIAYRDRSTELGLATEARLIEGFDHLRHSYDAYVEACFGLELIRLLFRPSDPHPEFLRGALSFLKLLGVGEGHLALRLHFATSLLRETGVAPDWRHCAECGAPLALDRAPERVRPPAGPVCRSCARPNDAEVPTAVLRYLLSEQSLPWGRVPGVT
ncbi:MAG: DNA repair protein RecO, partial [Planctomycetota bacterium]